MNEILTQEKSIYLQISDMIKNDILRDIILEEERVPSTNEFAKLFAINPATGELVLENIEAEAEQVMQNIGAVLEAAGCTYANVVKTTIFATDINDFAAVNGVYGKYFQVNPPARSFVQVAALPKGVHVEIEVVAVK